MVIILQIVGKMAQIIYCFFSSFVIISNSLRVIKKWKVLSDEFGDAYIYGAEILCLCNRVYKLAHVASDLVILYTTKLNLVKIWIMLLNIFIIFWKQHTQVLFLPDIPILYQHFLHLSYYVFPDCQHVRILNFQKKTLCIPRHCIYISRIYNVFLKVSHYYLIRFYSAKIIYS